VHGGKRVYVSDAPRVNPGGSVPKNFTGRAWLPPGSVVKAALPIMRVLGTASLPSRRLDVAEAEKAQNPRFNLGPLVLRPEREVSHAPKLPVQPIIGMAGVRVWAGASVF
jgi:hypothetical protein